MNKILGKSDRKNYEHLGRGSFGNVDRHKNKKGNPEYYAVKKIHINSMKLSNLQTEIKILENLNHSRIVHFYKVKKKNDEIWIYLDFCNGGDLKNFMQKRNEQYLPEGQVLAIFMEIVEGLVYLHDQNVIHRDLKPANILIHDGHIKITDFGLSKIMTYFDASASTDNGTLFYISPEREKGKSYTNSADVWSAGCILFELCTFQKAYRYWFDKDTQNSLLITFSQAMHDLIKSILQHNPKNRPSAKNLEEELKKMPRWFSPNEEIEKINYGVLHWPLDLLDLK